MTLAEKLEILQTSRGRGNFEHFQSFMAFLGNPHKSLRFLHVTGTNGKGTTCAFLSNTLTCAGYRVGLFTSPYIHRYQERIRVDGVEINDSDLDVLSDTVLEANLEWIKSGHPPLNSFELCTAIGFLYFRKCRCDLVVLEVGIGGRLDSTNVITENENVLSVITHIGLDHEKILGDSLDRIAFEKSGILKYGRNAVILNQSEAVLSVIEAECRKKNCPLTFAKPEELLLKQFSMEGSTFDYHDFQDVRITLMGKYQLQNAVTALSAIEILQKLGYGISAEAVHRGMLATRWVGRMELLHRAPNVIVDGAHNVQGISAFFESMNALSDQKQWPIILGVLADKNVLRASPLLKQYASKIYAVTPPSERNLSAKDLKARLEAEGIREVADYNSMKAALDDALCEAKEDDTICIVGSLYQVSTARSYFGKNAFDE